MAKKKTTEEELEPIGEVQGTPDEELEPIGEVQGTPNEELEPIGESRVRLDDMPVIPDDEDIRVPVVESTPVQMGEVGEDVARQSVNEAQKISEQLRDSGPLGVYLSTRAELAQGALAAKRLDDANLAGCEIIALAEAYRKLQELDAERKRRAEGRSDSAREALLTEIQDTVNRSLGHLLSGDRLNAKIRTIANEVSEITVGRASARLGKELGSIESSMGGTARREAESVIRNAEDAFAAIARREAREHGHEAWKKQLASKEMSDKIKDLANARAEDIAGTETAKLAAELRGEMTKKIDQAIEENLGGHDLRELVAEVADARLKEYFAEKQEQIMGEVRSKVQEATDGLKTSIEQVDQQIDDVAGFAREEVAKLRTEISELKEGQFGDSEGLRTSVERTASLIKQEVQRFNRELEQLRTRSSQNTADIKAEIEKVKVFTSEEIGRISLSLEDAKQAFSESSSEALDEDSVRKIVADAVKKKKK